MKTFELTKDNDTIQLTENEAIDLLGYAYLQYAHEQGEIDDPTIPDIGTWVDVQGFLADVALGETVDANMKGAKITRIAEEV